MAQPTLIKKAVQTPNGTVAAHDTLTSVTVAPDGLHVYALGAHAGARIIVVFARDPLNGALTQQQVVTSGSGSANIGSPGGGFERLAVSPDGKTLVVTGDDYGLGGTASLGIDAAGALSVQSLFDHPYGQTTQIAFSGDGRNVYVANYGNGLIETFGRNTATGALFQEGNLQVDAQGPLSGVAVSPDGLEVYSVTGSDIASDPNANSLSVFSRNTATGSLTLINTMPGVGGDLVTLSPDGKTVYSSNKNRGYGSSTVTVFNRDTSTEAFTVTQTLTNVQAGNNAEFSHIDDLIVSPDGQTVYVGSNGYDAVAFQRDTSSGLLTHVAGQDQFGGGFGLAASPDGTSLYTVNVRDNTITTYSTKNSLPAPATPAAPSILQENQAGYANTGALTIFGAAEHGATVTVYDGTLSLGTATADSATGVYSFTLNHALTDGPHSINVTASNSNGASAASTSTSVTVDTVPPTITLGTETSNNATTTLAKFGDVITETFTVAPSAYGQSVTVDSVTIDGQAATVLHGIGNSYTASHTVNAGDTNGLAGINVTAHDAAGNSASQAGIETVTVDTMTPVVSISTPSATVGTASQTISGTVVDAHPGTTISIYDNGNTNPLATATVINGAWSAAVTLASGTNSLVAVDTDLAGNAGYSVAVGLELRAVAASLTQLTLSTLTSFNGTYPSDSLIQDSAGNLFGTTESYRASGYGTVFELTKGNTTPTTLVSFNGTNGRFPRSGLIQDSAGNLFGTTESGGAYGYGTVFELAKGSTTATTLVSFNGTNGQYPKSGLVEDSAGNLFGTTQRGGASGYGTVFELTKGSMTSTTLVSFNGTNGQYPSFGGLVEDSAGNLFGTTLQGGAFGYGTVFELVQGNTTPLTLVSFEGTNGSGPYGGLVEDSAGNLFGTMQWGGAFGYGTVFELVQGNTTPTTLVSFNGTNGGEPFGGLIQDSAGNLFGATQWGGAFGYGTVFEISANVPAPATPASPTITQENQAGYANTGALTIFGAAERGATVTVYDGTLSLGTATADSATGVYNLTLNHALADGPHSINVTASNSNGASAASTSTSVTVDTVPPTITLGTETSNNPTTTLAKFGDVITETFTVAPSAYGQSVTVDSVTIDGQAATVLHGIGNTYTASYTVNVGDTNGLAGINVTAHDAAGNSASQAGNGTVTVDTILAVPVPPTPQHANTIVNLNGYTNIVTAPVIEPRATGKSGAAIAGGPFGGVTIPGTADDETITANGQNNTIAANGGNDTINAGFGTAHVTVSDADGNNTVTGSFGGSSVTLGNGDNIVSLGGYGNYIKVGDGHNTVDAGYGSETIEIAGGSAIVKAQGFYDVFNIDGGTTEITGFAGYATINLGAHFTGANSVDLRGFAGDIFTFAHGVGTITKPDGELVATINAPTGQTLSAIDDGTDGLKIVLGTIAPPPPPPSPVLVVLTETQWGVDITLAQVTKTVHLAGYDNKVTGGDGNHTIDGDNGGLVLTLGSGDNVISVNGYHDTIKLGVDAQGTYTGTGTGNNIVTGTLGSTTIHTGAGNQTINAAGFYNDITTGAGTSDITAGAGYSHVNTGNGHNTITAAGNENTVTTHDGDSTVTLTGWTNLIQAGAGHTQVSGGYFNTYKVTELGTHGGVEVLDFSTQFGDVLNLQDVIGTGSLRLNDSANGQDLLVSIVHGTTATQVADLHGLAGKSVLDLMASHSLVI